MESRGYTLQAWFCNYRNLFAQRFQQRFQRGLWQAAWLVED